MLPIIIIGGVFDIVTLVAPALPFLKPIGF